MFGFHSALMNDRAGRRLALERALVGVVDRNELRLEFQPQIDTRDGSLVGAEALLRWHNPRLGRIAPVEFIPILEATGQIEEVGAWVLRAACKQAAEWARNAQPVRVSVNVSARQLRDGSLSLAVNQALQQAKLAPQLLELELTETVLVENPTSTREMMDALRRTGVRVALDDFGTGYASLAYIRHFPMDVLKIDRQFVRGLPVDAENAAITSAITALARSLRLELVAEGVETEAEEEFLHSLHCHVVQGYRHARPMSNSDLVEWRRQRPWA
jgi:EAL domain-containing protein (putative c-di-GMP-specific phosphodiesterase class I)